MNENEPGILEEMARIIDETGGRQPAPAPQQHTRDTRERERPRPRPDYRNDGEARRAAAALEEARTSPFPEQHCELCNVASGKFLSAKRKMLSDRADSRGDKNKNRAPVLTGDEMAQIRKMIPEDMRHLNECPGPNGGFD